MERIILIKQKENKDKWIQLMDYLYFSNKELWEFVSDNVFDAELNVKLEKVKNDI